MLGKFSLRIEMDLRAKVKSAAALNKYASMNALIVEAIEEKIQRIEGLKNEKKEEQNV